MTDTIPVTDKDRLDEANLTRWMEANVALLADTLNR